MSLAYEPCTTVGSVVQWLASLHCGVYDRGYIHAVYTPVDSIVLSGNFVHTLSCQMQLEVQKSEQRLKLQSGFRMPYTHQLMFYVVADLVKKWTRREYLRPLKIEDNFFFRRTYVGERWLKAKGHRLEITLANFGDTDEKEPENEKENVPKKREAQFASSSPLVFYRSEAYDLVADKPLKAHKMEVGEEPPFEFVSKEIRRITKMELEEYDALYEYLQGRPQVEVAKGISQPASLLKCFGKALNHRRKQFAKERRKNESEKEVEETTERKRKLEAEVLKEKDEKMVKNRRVWNPCQSPEEENETDDPEVENMQLENAEVDKKKFFSSFSLFNAPDGDEKNHRNFLGFPVLNRSNRNWDDFLSYRNPVSEPSGPLISLPKEESEDGIEAEIDENEPDFHSSSYYIEEDFSTNLEPMLEIDFPEGEENEQDFQTFEFEPSLEMESFVPEEPEELILMPFVPWSPGDIEITISTSGDACYPCDDVGGPTDVAEQ
ncbi:unnamed protein product [Caenorhabditis auriculariae]|uniref:Uncharacterized protein n=1 Tax=Caenorhabditis auriculariae TaxID=2777116 RepID=A0A8S1HUD6_9PELO|nr:unnamed protein product [Caenorhabditis auriculariae]